MRQKNIVNSLPGHGLAVDVGDKPFSYGTIVFNLGVVPVIESVVRRRAGGENSKSGIWITVEAFVIDIGNVT